MKSLKRKSFTKICLTILFCVIISVVLLSSSYAEEPAIETDSDGYFLVTSYEQLRSLAAGNYAQGRYRLACDVISNDTENNYTIKISGVWGSSFTLDLNGYTLKRSCQSIDTCLFDIRGGEVCIFDSSKEKTGRCEFTGSVFSVRGGASLTVDGGTFCALDGYDNIAGNVFCVYSGHVTVNDGVFDTTNAGRGSDVIRLRHEAYLYDVPVCTVNGGEFYGRTGIIDIVPMNSFLKYGCFFPQVYVLGGEFYVAEYDEGANGFVNSINTWGDVIIGGGLHYTACLNPTLDPYRYVDGVTVNAVNVDYKGNPKTSYNEVSPPPLITVENALTYDSRLLEKCYVKLLERYNGPNEIFASFGTIKEQYADMIDYYLNGVPATVTVGASDHTVDAPKLVGMEKGANIKWYVCETAPGAGFDGADWVEMTGYENKPQPVGMLTRTADARDVYVWAEVRLPSGEYYSDTILYAFESEKQEMNGDATVAMNNPCLGNAVIAVVHNAPHYQSESDYVYEWTVDGVKVGSEKRFEIADVAYLGKKLSCRITSTKIEGALVTTPVTVTKKPNNDKPAKGVAEYLPGEKIIMLYGLSSLQEYTFSDSADTSELDWSSSWKPTVASCKMILSELGIAFLEGKTVYIHTRFKETDTTAAGKHVESSPYLLAYSVPLVTVTFENEINGTVYVPFTAAGDTVRLYYAKDPMNANTWSSYKWYATYPVSVVSPTVSVTPYNEQGYVELKLLSKGGCSLVASYFTYTEVVYKRINVVVYDPTNPTYGSANVAVPLEDVTLCIGESYSPSLPEIIPTPPAGTDFKWYLSESTQQGLVTFEKNDVASIDPQTGEITALSKGSVYVSLLNPNGVEMDRFLLTVSDFDGTIKAERVEFTERQISLPCGMSTTVRYHIFPSNSNEPRVWTVADPSVATVDGNGRVTARGVGKTTVTLTVGECSADCELTVTESHLGASYDPSACKRDDTCPMTPFTDLKKATWYHDGVHFCISDGLMNGTSGVEFSPNMSMSRAMVVTVLYRLDGSPEVSEVPPFTDIKTGWYYNAVKWAYANNIVTGVSKTEFAPNGDVTREQIATILYRYAAYKGKDTSASAGLAAFPDHTKTGAWAKTAMEWAVAEGLVTGAVKDGITVLDPKGVASRAQVATILYRFCKA